MIAGISVTAAYIISYSFLCPDLSSAGHRLWGISPGGFGTLGMALNVAVPVTVALLTPPPRRAQALVESIRVPRGAGEARELSL